MAKLQKRHLYLNVTNPTERILSGSLSFIRAKKAIVTKIAAGSNGYLDIPIPSRFVVRAASQWYIEDRTEDRDLPGLYEKEARWCGGPLFIAFSQALVIFLVFCLNVSYT